MAAAICATQFPPSSTNCRAEEYTGPPAASAGSGLRWFTGCIPRRGRVGIAVLHAHADPRRLRVPCLDQPAPLVRTVLPCPGCRPRAVAPARLWLHQPQAMAGTGARGLLVVPPRLSGLGGQGLASLHEQWLARFVTVALRASGLRGLFIQVKPLFHGRHELGPHVWQTPLLLLPGLPCVFLRTWRPVARAIEAAQPHATTLSASNRHGQRARPAGAGGQATASTCAACLPVNWRCAPGRAGASSAPRCSSTNRGRMRPTVAVPTSSAAALSSSRRPSSALSRIRARVSFRALGFPLRRRCSKAVRSSGLKSPRYVFLGRSGRSFARVYPDVNR
jgi:hypothetical protein